MEHDHDHHATGNASLEETSALLEYMIRHNQAHAKELSESAAPLSRGGHEESFAKIQEALALFEKANAELQAAVDLLREGK